MCWFGGDIIRCLECPIWHPYCEWEGYCIHTDAITDANSSCRTMSDISPNMVHGVPIIDDSLINHLKDLKQFKLIEDIKDNGLIINDSGNKM